jgi:hypothetical protein
MRKLWDFQCPKGHVSEHLVENGVQQVWCTCGDTSKRIISPININLDGSDPGFPGAHAKWVKEHERAGGK